MRKIRNLMTVLALGLLMSCGGGGGGGSDRCEPFPDCSGGGGGGGGSDAQLATLSINGPLNLAFNQVATYTVQAIDDAGEPASGESVNLASLQNNPLSATTVTTNSSGQATFTLTGANTGADTITATSGTISATLDITVASNNSIDLFSGSPTLPSASSAPGSGVTLTAVVRNSANNLVAGATVTFSTDSGVVVCAAAPCVTNASGQITAELTTNFDPTNRTITVTATTGGSSDTATIQVTGTTLTVTGPTTLGTGTPATYTFLLRDSNGTGLAGRSVVITETIVNGAANTSTVNTNASGQANINLTPTSNGTVSGTALGLSASVTVAVDSTIFNFTAPAAGTEINLNTATPVTVLFDDGSLGGDSISFSTTRGVITGSPMLTNGSGNATVSIQSANSGTATITATGPGGRSIQRQVEFVATTPARLDLQADPAVIPTNSQSVIKAVVRDAQNNLVKNQTVQFTLTDVTGGTLTAGTAITDSQGTAQIQYNSSGTTSADGGVRIDAEVQGFPAVTDFATLTVGGQALRITLGSGNEIQEPTTTTYALPYVAIVTDAAGNPPPAGTTFRLSVLPLEYQKGRYLSGTPPLAIDYRVDVFDEDGPPLDNVDPFAGPRLFGCRSEDVNGNGLLDPGEDDNGNGTLQPGNPASVPPSVPLDSTGAAFFNITYPQDRGNWTLVRLRAIASVAGSETTEDQIILLPISAEDAQAPSPPGFFSPYGLGDTCDNPN